MNLCKYPLSLTYSSQNGQSFFFLFSFREHFLKKNTHTEEPLCKGRTLPSHIHRGQQKQHITFSMLWRNIGLYVYSQGRWQTWPGPGQSHLQGPLTQYIQRNQYPLLGPPCPWARDNSQLCRPLSASLCTVFIYIWQASITVTQHILWGDLPLVPVSEVGVLGIDGVPVKLHWHSAEHIDWKRVGKRSNYFLFLFYWTCDSARITAPVFWVLKEQAGLADGLSLLLSHWVQQSCSLCAPWSKTCLTPSLTVPQVYFAAAMAYSNNNRS